MNENNFVEFELLLDVLNECGTVKLPVQGKSMQPFLKEGRDSVFLSVPDGNYNTGDIIVYKRGNAYFIHRITEVNDDTVSIMGDNEINPDNGVPKERIVASVRRIEREGRIITEKDLIWKFYSKVYIKQNVRNFFLKLHKIRKD